MVFHFLRNLLHFNLRGSGARNENDIVIRFEGACLLSKRRSDNAPCAVALNCAADFLAAGYAHPRLVEIIFQNVSNKTGGRFAFSAVIHAAKVLVFL